MRRRQYRSLGPTRWNPRRSAPHSVAVTPQRVDQEVPVSELQNNGSIITAAKTRDKVENSQSTPRQRWRRTKPPISVIQKKIPEMNQPKTRRKNITPVVVEVFVATRVARIAVPYHHQRAIVLQLTVWVSIALCLCVYVPLCLLCVLVCACLCVCLCVLSVYSVFCVLCSVLCALCSM